MDCWANSSSPNTAGNADEITLHTFTNDEVSYQKHNWCLDSGAASHMTANQPDLDQGHEVTFKKNVAFVKNQKQEIVTEATRKGDVYFIRENSEVVCIADGETKSKLMEWHERLGHVNEVSLKTWQIKPLF